jgi:ligand-binding sensor domain-containing protein
LDAFAFDVSALAASEAEGAVTIYAGTSSSGIRRSTDDGRTWTDASGGLRFAQGSISTITALAATGTQVYAILGATGSRVFVSANQGQSWEPVNNSLPSQLQTTSLAVVGSNVFAGALGSGVFRLTDNTQSWTESNRGLSSRSVNSVVLYSGALFAGTLGGGVFRSADGGVNWAAVNEGLPVGVNAFALAVSGQTLLAGTFGDGVFRYDAAANRWVAANTGLENRFVNALVVSGGAVFAGVGNGRDLGNVYRSLDQGGSWQAVGQSLDGYRVLALAANGNTLVAGTDGGGVFLSPDQGVNWRPANTGLTSRDVRSLAALGGTLFAGTLRGGVFRSVDGGANWTTVNRELPPNLPVFALAAEGPELFAGTVYGVFRSSDQGETWRQVNAGLLDVAVTALTLDGATLYAGTKNGGVFLSQIR